MTVIHGINSTVKEMTIIIQGSIGVKNTIQSHYQVFQKLYEEHPLVCYLVVENPVTESFKVTWSIR